MKSLAKDKKIYGYLLVPIAYCLILLTSLNNVSSSLSILGLLFIIFILVFSSFFLFYKILKLGEISKFSLIFLTISLAFFILLIVGLYSNLNMRGYITVFQFITISFFTLYFTSIIWTNNIKRILGRISAVFISLHFIIWGLSGFPSFFASIYNNSNLTGPYMYFAMFFLFISYKNFNYKVINIFFLILGFILIFASGTRSIMFAGIIALLIFIFWNRIIYSLFTYISFLLIFFSSLISFLFIYPKLPEWKYFGTVEKWMLEKTGKSLMSGREDIWAAIIHLTNEKPLFGLGTGIQTNELLGLSHSSHNYYLNTIMQNGYFGLLIILFLFSIIWIVFWKVRYIKEIKIVAAYFISILIYQSFEISLTQNQLSLGLLQWFIISFGLSIYLCESQKHTSNEEQLVGYTQEIINIRSQKERSDLY